MTELTIQKIETTEKKGGLKALVIYISEERVGKIDRLASVLGVPRSEAARKLLDLAFVALEHTLPAAIGAANAQISGLKQKSKAKTIIGRIFGRN
jgi:hypothetical protein